MRWLAYVHPAAMLVLLVLAVWVLRLGLGVRRARLSGRRADSARHRAVARWVVPLLVVGWGAGLGSILWLRGLAPFESVHFPLATAAVLGMAAAGVLGFVLERRIRPAALPAARRAHALLGAGGLLLALAAAIAGMAILP
jgi:hypothetical protein